MLEIAILKKVRILEGLSENQLTIVQKMLHKKMIKKGEYILKDESFGDTLHLLVEGKVRVTKELVKGLEIGRSDEKVLATLDSGLLPTFGENGVLGHAPRTANVIALTDCTIYNISKTDFDTVVNADPRAAYIITLNIAKVLSDRLQSTDDNLVKLATALYIAVQG